MLLALYDMHHHYVDRLALGMSFLLIRANSDFWIDDILTSAMKRGRATTAASATIRH